MTEAWEPIWTACPGKTLKKWLDENKMRQRDLAVAVGWSTKFVSQLMTGKCGLSPRTAMELEAVTGHEARLWLELEAYYQLSKLQVS